MQRERYWCLLVLVQQTALACSALLYEETGERDLRIQQKRPTQNALSCPALLWETGLFIGLFFSICGMLGILVGL